MIQKIEKDVSNDKEINSDGARKLIEDFFGKVDTESDNGAYTWCMQVSKDKRQILKQAPCHAQFVKLNSPYWIASMFFTNSRNEDLANTYWDWVTDKKESPWKHLVKDLEVLKDKNGNRCAWIIPGKTQNKQEFRYIKNFAIACRGLTEHPGSIRMWKLLVNKGVPAPDALLYASYYTRSESGLIAIDGNRSMGWHWPITGLKFNINSFRAGKYTPMFGINDGWETPFATPLDNSRPERGKTIKTKFSQYDSIDLQSILDHYKKWIKGAEKKVEA